MKLSVVISAHNAESKIEQTLLAVKGWTNEIIFVNNSSTDNTRSIAERFTDKIYDRPNNPMLNINKNFGFSKASGEWILNLDHDEVVTEEMREEIKALLKSNPRESGFYVPRKNIIFGKWIAHSGWYPDYQMRLFRKEKGKFAEKHVHELIEIKGDVGHLKNPMIHYNYENISQFLLKMTNIYTPSEAENLINSGYKARAVDVLRMPFQEFLSRFFARQGYKDGVHGLAVSLLMAFYHLVVFMRIWEAQKYEEFNENALSLLQTETKRAGKELKHWMITSKNQEEKNIVKKYARKIGSKISS